MQATYKIIPLGNDRIREYKSYDVALWNCQQLNKRLGYIGYIVK